MERERLEILLNRYFDLALTAGEKSELEQELLVSANAREAFWEFSRWHGAIRQWGEEEWGRCDTIESVARAPQAVRPTRPRPAPKRAAVHGRGKATRSSFRSTAGRLLALAALLVLGFFAWTKWQPAKSTEGMVIAQLVHTTDAVWADGSSHQEGEALRQGRVKLKSGALQIHFSRGAHVVLEGPAEFELLTDNSGALLQGKLSATVPESAHGFTVRMQDVSVVDHGTRFGCMISPEIEPEVHVFQGAVGVETSDQSKRELHVNEAVRITGSTLQTITVNEDAFLTEEKLLARRWLDKWKQFNQEFSKHRGMLMHFDFENAGGTSQLINRATGANGTIEGCEQVTGRWPGKGALKFDGDQARIQMSVPGQFSALTFIAFVRIDSMLNRENSLVQSKVNDVLGETNWYISNEGALGWRTRAAPRGNAGQWLRVFSNPGILSETPGSWHMVATVYDGSTVTHYLDGKKVGSTEVQLPGPLILGDLQIGNGNTLVAEPRTPNEVGVGFSGSIDQLSILSVPLSEMELENIYQQGNPEIN